MKPIRKIALLISMTAILFYVTALAQEDPVKNQEQNQTKTQLQSQDQNQVKNQEQIKAQGDPQSQLQNQNQNQLKQQNKNQTKTQTKVQNQIHGGGFVDIDGDGINDNAIDSDGDGIPNGQDPDYVKPNDGTGQMNQYGKGKGENKKGNMWGPNDGTGYGPGGKSGNCDGTGPKRGGRG
jgi:hypothetical protein